MSPQKTNMDRIIIKTRLTVRAFSAQRIMLRERKKVCLQCASPMHHRMIHSVVHWRLFVSQIALPEPRIQHLLFAAPQRPHGLMTIMRTGSFLTCGQCVGVTRFSGNFTAYSLRFFHRVFLLVAAYAASDSTPPVSLPESRESDSEPLVSYRKSASLLLCDFEGLHRNSPFLMLK